MHTHPAFKGESMTHCKVGAQPHKPNAGGGGSPADWDSARRIGVDVYSVGPERVFRLPWNTAEGDRDKNPYGYDMDRQVRVDGLTEVAIDSHG
jgi:hypothetical protein